MTSPGLAEDTLWAERFALRTAGVTSSAIRELLKLTEQPDVISFAGGLPAPEVFPLERIEEAAQRVLAEHGAAALQYSTTEGYLPLRELLVRHMARYGIEVTPANVLITSGAQQALDLIGKLLINSGDVVLTEAPTVPVDDDGLCVDKLEEALRAGPKFMYVLPNFQNPAGTTLTLARRQRLIELASHYGVPIVEDDPYGQLRYEGSHLPPLVKLDAEYHGCANGERAFRSSVLYLGTLSKVLAPGLRLGWVVGPAPVVAKMVQLKQGSDLHTSTFTQMVAYEAAKGGFLDRHVPVIRRVYGERRNAMLAAMEEHFPPGVRWTRPQGGLFLWVTLPKGMDSQKVLAAALEEKVAFVPGGAFFPRGGGAETCRLNFSYCTPQRIEEGIARLGRVLRKQMP
jgi:2-aminoadipate transaminase